MFSKYIGMATVQALGVAIPCLFIVVFMHRVGQDSLVALDVVMSPAAQSFVPYTKKSSCSAVALRIAFEKRTALYFFFADDCPFSQGCISP